MKFRNRILHMMTTLGLLLGSTASYAAARTQPMAQPSVFLSSYAVKGISQSELDRISQEFEIDRVLDRKSHSYEVLVPETRRNEFLLLAPSAQLLQRDSAESAKNVFSRSRAQLSSSAGYHSFDEVVALLHSMAQAHPDLTQLENYGQSQGGKPLLALRLSTHLLSTHLTAAHPRPRVLLTAATHGDEIITTEVLLSLMDQMISEAHSNPRFARILEQIEIDFIPVVNPDGFSLQERYDNGSDPNRSYPYPDKPDATPTASIAAELRFIERNPMIGSIDFHAYSGLVMYPWSYTRQPLESLAKAKFETLTGKMAATNQYGHGQISEILYTAVGSSIDYFFWKYKAVALGIELGDSKAPSPNEFPKYIQQQQESTWIYLESFLK